MYLVFKILSSDEGVQEPSPGFTLHCFDLTAGTADARVVIESFPQMIYRFTARTRADIQQYTDVGV
jgi:hypothetical protein